MSDWSKCPSCGLNHAARADGRCPRCGVSMSDAPAQAVAVNPYAPPRQRVEVETASATDEEELARLREMALWQRRLSLAILGAILSFGLTGALFGAAGTPQAEGLAVLLQLVGIGMRVLFGYCCYKLAAALGSTAKVGWAIGGATITIIAALILSSRVTKRVKAAGFKTGFLGPNLKQFDG